MKFEIEGIFKITGRGYLIMAVCLENDLDFSLSENNFNFYLSDKAKLGNIEVKPSKVFTTAKDKNGNFRMNVFTFLLKNDADFEKLKIGEIVNLTN